MANCNILQARKTNEFIVLNGAPQCKTTNIIISFTRLQQFTVCQDQSVIWLEISTEPTEVVINICKNLFNIQIVNGTQFLR